MTKPDVTVVLYGVSWTFTYSHTYCPRCGSQGIWLEGSDHYVGATGYCFACQHTHLNAGGADFSPFDEFGKVAAAVIIEGKGSASAAPEADRGD